MNKLLKIFLVSLALNGLFFNSITQAQEVTTPVNQVPKYGSCIGRGMTGASGVKATPILPIDIVALKSEPKTKIGLTDRQKQRCDLLLENLFDELKRRSSPAGTGSVLEKSVEVNLASALGVLRLKCADSAPGRDDPFDKFDIWNQLILAITNGTDQGLSDSSFVSGDGFRNILLPLLQLFSLKGRTDTIHDRVVSKAGQIVSQIVDALRGYIYGSSGGGGGVVIAGSSAALDAVTKGFDDLSHVKP